MLIVSGVAGARNVNAAGEVEGSWYARLNAVPQREIVADHAQQAAGTELQFSLPIYDPPLLPDIRSEIEAQARSAAIDEGVLLHALLERLTHQPAWPIDVPNTAVIAQWLTCSHDQAMAISVHAKAILSNPELEPYFNPQLHAAAFNEFDVAHNGNLHRFDRIVKFKAEIWILDYKRQLLDSERAAYRAQLARYRQAGETVFPNMSIRTALITVDGRLWEL